MKTGDNPIWEWTAPDELAYRIGSRSDVPAGYVEVGIQAIGICSTDLHIIRGTLRAGTPPYPLGHELSGTIVRIGAGVPERLLGKRVCVDPLVGCGICSACKSGNKQLCTKAAEIGIHLPGGWQRYITLPADNVYEIPDGIGDAEATQIENIHCCLGGIDKLDIPLGTSAAVFGDGPSGLYFVQLLRAAGAGKIVRAAPLITHTFEFTKLDKAAAFAQQKNTDAIKVIVTVT
ncbi:alcohol dehydrogenase catalytic domain-containing protein [Paenibacillus sp. MBLB4367]|uniref:alcohol dehydrogenase catalytic domain-containing protein n=1 Tax=Paenibacillus sp. MBLB4367 TaxID=3384767 RepID=UPI0039081853